MKIHEPFVFASDLDGTLVPITTIRPPVMQRTRRLLLQLRHSGCQICYVTGRNFTMAKQAVKKHNLPIPDWWVCDLGGEIYNGTGQPMSAWNEQSALGPMRKRIHKRLGSITGLIPQESHLQGPGRCSYYCPCDAVEQIRDIANDLLAGIQPRLRTVASVDIANRIACIDVISARAGKSRAVKNIASHLGFDIDCVFYAGDSGNDIDALLSGMRAVLVGNATADVHSALLDRMDRCAHAKLYFASACHVDGVIEGLIAHAFAHSGSWRLSPCE